MSNKNNLQDITGALASAYNSSIVVNTNTNNVINVNKLGSVIGNVLALNSAASNMYGVPVKWFRSIPQDRSKDVLFMEWTLYNVEDCPLNLNVIHNDASYDEAVNALLNGTLGYNPDVKCSHHSHEHNESAHSCGSHGCGNHGCH